MTQSMLRKNVTLAAYAALGCLALLSPAGLSGCAPEIVVGDPSEENPDGSTPVPTGSGGEFNPDGTPVPTGAGGEFDPGPPTPVPTGAGGDFNPDGTPVPMGSGGALNPDGTPVPTGAGGDFNPDGTPVPMGSGGAVGG